jgi:hypothetical protein
MMAARRLKFGQHMHRHTNQSTTLTCLAFMSGVAQCHIRWLWHVFMALHYLYNCVFIFPWVRWWPLFCFVRYFGQPLSSSSSWPSHVRNHPFLPCPGRHAYFLIERWLFETPFCSLHSDEDDREKTLQLDVLKISSMDDFNV